MRRFSSYRPIVTSQNYYVPRTDLVKRRQAALIGEVPEEGGHYITVWAPRQRGKTWIMQQVMWQTRNAAEYEWLDIVKVNLQDQQTVTDVDRIAYIIAQRIVEDLDIDPPLPTTLGDLHTLFTPAVLKRPLIVIMD